MVDRIGKTIFAIGILPLLIIVSFIDATYVVLENTYEYLLDIWS